jgi:hypothetical protein
MNRETAMCREWIGSTESVYVCIYTYVNEYRENTMHIYEIFLYTVHDGGLPELQKTAGIL